MAEVEFYEEKEFEDGIYFRSSPGGAWAKKPSTFERENYRAWRRCKTDDLLEAIAKILNLKTAKEVQFAIGLHHSAMSRIRSGRAELSSGAVIRIHDACGMDVDEIRKFVGIEFKSFKPQKD